MLWLKLPACLESRRSRVQSPALAFKFQRNKMFLPCSLVNIHYCGDRDREIASSASDRPSSNFESCVWRAVPSRSSHHPQEVLLAQFSLYVRKGGLKPQSFHYLGYRTVDSRTPQAGWPRAGCRTPRAGWPRTGYRTPRAGWPRAGCRTPRATGGVADCNPPDI